MTDKAMPDEIYAVPEKNLWINTKSVPLCPTGGVKYIRADLAHQEALDVGVFEKIKDAVEDIFTGVHDHKEIAKYVIRICDEANRLNTPIPESRKINATVDGHTFATMGEFIAYSNGRKDGWNANIKAWQERSALTHPAPKDALETLIDNFPLGHISMRRLTDGRISITTHDGVGGGQGKVEHYIGKTPAEAISKTLGETND